MIDDKIEESIKTVVKEAQQPDELSDKIVAWFYGVAEGNESITDIDIYSRRCKLCFDIITLKEDHTE